jgi:hypothetical protein
MRYWFTTAALAAATVLAAPAPARAGLIPVQVSVTPEGGNYQFTYAIVLPTDALLQPGDYFTIYNFDGLVPGSAMASGSVTSGYWTFSSSPNAPPPPGILPVANANSATSTDLTWTYNGPVVQGSQTGIGNFAAVSLYPDTTQSWFTAITGTVSGVADANITPTSVPVPTAPPPGVPEPTTLGIAAIGLPFVGLARLLRRRGSSSAHVQAS